MKRHILFFIPFFLMLFIHTKVITQIYTAEITITDLWFNSDESFKVFLRADIYIEGVLIPPDSNYYYEWYTDFSHDQQGWYLLTAGMGKYETAPDQYLEDSIWVYAIISDSVNHTFENIKTDIIGPIEMTGRDAVTVDFAPYSGSGILIDDYIKPKHWRYTINKWRDGYRGLLTLDENERIQASPNFLSSLEEKFRHWNNNNTDIIHYKSFYIDNDSIVIIANYKTVKENVVIKTVLMEGVESEYDSIQFKDPWVVDTTDSRFYTTPFGYHSLGMQTPFLSESSPLQLTFTSKYQGVFLRENEIFDPDLPIYSVRAQQNPIIPFHGQNITWYFQGWQGDPDSVIFQNPDKDSTAVIFKESNAIAKALYKGHLASNNNQATAFNNGRQIAYEYDYPTSKWHLVYEDNGQIYYTFSTNGGSTWQQEKKLSYAGSGTNSQPSIYLFQPDTGPEAIQQEETSPILLGVVWNRELGYLNNRPVLRFMRIDATWSEEITMENQFPYNCQPVISGRMENYIPKLYVICRYAPIGLQGLALFKISEAQQWFSLVSNPLITGTSIYSINPSISVDPGGIFHFCWEEANKIYYSNYVTGTFFPPPLEISGPAWEGYNHRPSITMDYLEKINVVWEQQGLSYPGTSFNHRQYFDDEWGIIQRVTTRYQFLNYPSIGAVDESEIGELKSSFVHETLSEDDPHINSLSYDGEKWNWQPEAFPGQHPGMSSYGLELMTVWTNHTLGLPYLVKNQHWDTDELVSEIRESISNDHYRTLLVDLKDITTQRLEGQVSLSIGKVEVLSNQGTQAVSFPVLSDSLSQQLFTQTSSFLVTENFQQLNFQYRLWMNNFNHAIKIPQTALYKIILQENSANIALLRELNLSSISTDSLTFEEMVTVNLLPFRGKTINLRMLVLPEYQSLLQNYITRVDIREYSSQMIGEQLVVESILNEQNIYIPKEFGLNQNYPNPFNPSTTIAFDLPKDILVLLEIYDITGRRICTLVNEPKEAGMYQVIWNGNDDHSNSVASGVYVYRIQAGDYVQSKKLLFMK